MSSTGIISSTDSTGSGTGLLCIVLDISLLRGAADRVNLKLLQKNSNCHPPVRHAL